MKRWVPVYSFKGYDITHLKRAEVGDCMDYKIEPPLSQDDATYPTIGDAIKAIDENKLASDEGGGYNGECVVRANE